MSNAVSARLTWNMTPHMALFPHPLNGNGDTKSTDLSCGQIRVLTYPSPQKGHAPSFGLSQTWDLLFGLCCLVWEGPPHLSPDEGFC